MKNLIIVVILTLNALTLLGQEKDPNKMNRDLKIAEDIISSIFKSESEGGHFYTVRPKATYVDGFGVMINLSGGNHMYSKNMSKSFSFTWDDGNEPIVIDLDELEDIKMQAKQLALEAEELVRIKEREEREKEYIKESRERRYEDDSKERDSEEFQMAMKNLYKRVMVVYFTDYSDLIGQLDDNEKIMLTSQVGGTGSSEVIKMNGSVTREDIVAYKEGKLSKDEFQDTIIFSEEEGTRKSADLELLSSVFERMYKTDLATTFYSSSSIPYERMQGFGVIFKMKVYSSTSHGKNNHKITATGQSGLTQEERDEIVDAMYPQFEKELKENILDYGKTVKSLKPEESMVVQVKLTECKPCKMPRQIDVSVQQSVLMAYDSGKMNRTEALNNIKVKEGK